MLPKEYYMIKLRCQCHAVTCSCIRMPGQAYETCLWVQGVGRTHCVALHCYKCNLEVLHCLQNDFCFVSAHSFKLRRIKRNETAAYFPYKGNPPYAISVFNSVVYRAHSSEAWHRHRPEANLFTSLPTMHFICMRPKNMQKKERKFCHRCSFLFSREVWINPLSLSPPHLSNLCQ